MDYTAQTVYAAATIDIQVINTPISISKGDYSPPFEN